MGLPLPPLSLYLVHLDDVVVVAEGVHQAVGVDLALVVLAHFIAVGRLAGILATLSSLRPKTPSRLL